MTYTQYHINDWDEYLNLGWLDHYDKAIMPQQDINTAKPVDEGGKDITSDWKNFQQEGFDGFHVIWWYCSGSPVERH